MKTSWQKALAMSLPLAAILVTAPVVSAHDNDSQREHRQIHRDLGDIHEDFHQTPSSRREHKRFHRQLKREHRAADRDLRNNWRRSDDRYNYGDRYYDNHGYGDAYADRYRYGR
jgi:hypothetical protein